MGRAEQNLHYEPLRTPREDSTCFYPVGYLFVFVVAIVCSNNFECSSVSNILMVIATPFYPNYSASSFAYIWKLLPA